MKTKAEIRKELKAAVADMSAEAKKIESEALCHRLLNDPGIRSVPTLGIFLPLPDEPDLKPALIKLLNMGVELVLPFPDENNLWHFHRVARLESKNTGPWNLDFPEAGVPVPAADLEIILVPGRGFTPKGQRIGRGKGIYDRLLQNHRGRRIGIGFRCQLRETLPRESHDIPLTEVWTAL